MIVYARITIFDTTSMQSRTLKAVTIVEILSAIFGFWGGIPLLIDPSGRILNLEMNLLSGLPISDFLLPGIWLFVVYGCGCSLAAYGLWTHKRWGWQLAILISFIWISWVAFELYFWGMSWLVWPWLIPPVIALLLLSRCELRKLGHHNSVA
ncbi:MAG TPA: DUF2127 domain-containing protein [Nitrososphaeraceae archaeon]|nr:DUF2127 domain-containing protein [Nitrososphaeraceae archaeon]